MTHFAATMRSADRGTLGPRPGERVDVNLIGVEPGEGDMLDTSTWRGGCALIATLEPATGY